MPHPIMTSFIIGLQGSTAKCSNRILDKSSCSKTNRARLCQGKTHQRHLVAKLDPMHDSELFKSTKSIAFWEIRPYKKCYQKWLLCELILHTNKRAETFHIIK